MPPAWSWWLDTGKRKPSWEERLVSILVSVDDVCQFDATLSGFLEVRKDSGILVRRTCVPGMDGI